MNDEYRRLLSSYRKPPSEFHLSAQVMPVVRPMDARRASVLADLARRMISADNEPVQEFLNRRQRERRPFTTPLLLTPCSAALKPAMEETDTVVGKDLSLDGIGFIYSRALTNSLVLVTLQAYPSRPICLLTEVVHSRAFGKGVYVMGGRFLDRIELQMGVTHVGAHRQGERPAR